MRALVRTITLSLGMFCAPLMAMSQGELLRLAGDFNLLSAEVNMMFYDPDNAEYAAAAVSRLRAVSARIEPWIESLPSADQASAETAWQELQETLKGEDYWPGLLSGYDATLNARYTIANDVVREVLMAQPLLQAEALPAPSYAWLLTTRVLSGYMAVAAAPFGSYALSADDDDTRLMLQVMELDQLWTRLAATESESRALYVRAHRRWQFIRETILNATQQSLPFIVRYQSEAILRELEGLAEL